MHPCKHAEQAHIFLSHSGNDHPHEVLRVIGRVAMDMIAIDVTGLDVQLGTEVELWGKTRLIDDVAEANGTIGYELLCRLSNRPLRKVV